MSGGVKRTLAAGALLAGIAVGAVPLAEDLVGRPVLSVRVAGEFQRVPRSDLEDAVRRELQTGGFFAVDVERVRRAAMMLPWVRQATVRRVWPDSIHIAVTERVAVARWNETALLEDDASVFTPREGVSGYALARLQGPSGSHAEVLEQYKRLATALGTFASGVARVSLSGHGQWEIEFANGMTLVPPVPLDVAELKRFTGILPGILGERIEQAARIDLRYANGFAVRWRDGGPQPEGGKG